MRKIMTLALVACVCIATLAAPAGAENPRNKRVRRTIETSYSAPAGGLAVAGDFYAACKHGEGAGCVMITPKPGELFALAEIEDATGQPVHGFVTDIEAEQIFADFCGATEETVFLGSDGPFLVWIFAGPCTDGTPATATTGTVTVTLAKRG